jgi:tetratricopeptide (TPR) repeat protein
MSIPILSPSPLSQLPSSNFNEEGLRSQVQVVENSSSLSSSRDIQGSRRVSVIQNNHQSSCSPHQRLLHRSQTTFDVLLPPLQHQQNKRKTQQQILPSLEQRRATTGGQGIIRSNNRTSITNRKINDNDTFQSLVTTKKQSNSWLLPYQNDESDSSNKNDAIAKSLHLPLHIVIPGILSCDVMVLRDMSPSQTMDVNISMALKDFSRSMYQSSIVRLNRTILKNPHSFLPRFLRGICHYYLECYIASKRDFSVCCMNTCNNNHKDAEYDRALAFFNRSVVWMKMNNSERAMSDINEAIDIYSFEMGFFSNRALLYRRRGNFEAAQQDYKMMRRIEADEIRENDEGAIPIRRDLASIPMRVRTDLLKRPNAIATQSSARIRKTMIGRQALQGNKSPGSKRARSQLDLKTSVYGQVHSALTCPPEQRTKAHLEVLVKESRMMPAFAHLDTRQLNTLWQFLEYKSYTSNTRLFEEGDSAEDYMLVWSGSVSARVCKRNSLIKHSDNVARALAMEREFTVNTMKAGETLGEAIMLEGGVRKASCVTEEPSEILLLKKEHFRQTFHVFLQKSHDEKVDFLSSFDFLSHWDSKFKVFRLFCLRPRVALYL